MNNHPPGKIPWSSKDGIVGAAVLAILFSAGGAGTFLALPVLATIVTGLAMTLPFNIPGDVLGQVLATLGLTAGVYGLTTKRGRNFFRYTYLGWIKKMRTKIIKEDPTKARYLAMDRMEQRYQALNAGIDMFRQGMISLKNDILTNDEEMERSLEDAARFEELNKPGDVDVHLENAGRLKADNTDLVHRYQKMTMQLSFMMQMAETLRIKLLKMENKTKSDERRKRSLQGSNQAISQSAALLGSSPEQEVYDEAEEIADRQMAEDEARLELFESDTKDLMNDQSMDKLLFTTEGRKLLEEWRTKNKDLLDQTKLDDNFDAMMDGLDDSLRLPSKILNLADVEIADKDITQPVGLDPVKTKQRLR